MTPPLPCGLWRHTPPSCRAESGTSAFALPFPSASRPAPLASCSTSSPYSRVPRAQGASDRCLSTSHRPGRGVRLLQHAPRIPRFRATLTVRAPCGNSLLQSTSRSMPSPSARASLLPQGEGQDEGGGECIVTRASNHPHPNPLPEGEGEKMRPIDAPLPQRERPFCCKTALTYILL